MRTAVLALLAFVLMGHRGCAPDRTWVHLGDVCDEGETWLTWELSHTVVERDDCVRLPTRMIAEGARTCCAELNGAERRVCSPEAAYKGQRASQCKRCLSYEGEIVPCPV